MINHNTNDPFHGVTLEMILNALVEEYGAYTSSLFINMISGDTNNIEEVNEIWLVVGDNDAFVETVKNRIEETLMGVG